MGITERIDNITHLPPERLATVLPPPRSVKVEITARCNFACSFCARGDMLRQQGDMDHDLYRRIIKEMRYNGVEELGLFYLGESLLCPWIVEAVSDAKEVGFPYVFLTTNGSLLSRGKADAMFRAGLDSLKFSYNFSDREQFSNVTHVKPSLWDTVRVNITAARLARDIVEGETGHRCGLYASYIRYDDQQDDRMESAVHWLRDIVDEVYELPLYNQAGFCTKKIREDNEEWSPTAGNMGRIGGLVPPLPCWALFSEGHVSYRGVLTGCCFSHTPDFDFGDLSQMSFMDAWNSLSAQKLRAANLAKDVRGTACENCVAYS